jgi:probable non-F420 flavinoid oxidoreductase
MPGARPTFSTAPQRGNVFSAMTLIGFHASHEQIDPRSLLKHVRLAEEAGFDAAMCSDHLSPWTSNQGESGFAWSWLGAALASTSLSFGTVSAPGQRYHPVVWAQGIATLAQMFPGRFWVAAGSGEAMNEHVTGDAWPRKEVREARLLECIEVTRRLLEGDLVSHEGLIRVEEARVYSLPQEPPAILGAAVTPATARWAGSWADGLITVNQPTEVLREVLSEFREGGGEGKRTALQVHLSYARNQGEALAVAHEQWAAGVLGPPLSWDLPLPRHFDAAVENVRPEDLHESVLISNDLAWHAERLAEYLELGFDQLYLHHVGKEQREFIEAFGEHVLDQIRRD